MLVGDAPAGSSTSVPTAVARNAAPAASRPHLHPFRRKLWHEQALGCRCRLHPPHALPRTAADRSGAVSQLRAIPRSGRWRSPGYVRTKQTISGFFVPNAPDPILPLTNNAADRSGAGSQLRALSRSRQVAIPGVRTQQTNEMAESFFSERSRPNVAAEQQCCGSERR